MPRFSTKDADIHYETMGDGPPLLLIAGLASDNASWGPVSPMLSRHFKLMMPDNRGAGRTKTDAPLSIDAMAEDCAALLDHLEIDRAHVLGHSMGGVIAMTLAAKSPERIDRLVLAASCAKKPARTFSVIDTLLLLREAGVGDELWLRSFFHWLFKPKFFENKNAVDAAIALSIAYPYAQSVTDLRRQVDAVRTYDASALPAALQAETLLLAGEHDLMFSPEEIEDAFAAAPDARLHILPGAAHSLHWDDPAGFAESVIAFLGR
ncbi:alpha/beta fold hydrolase [Hyphococcus sp.]|uniref:alpha/beta fold hydrolase n=1 Tax=Hyphococcus sp. TaxID=2038636 RepID=UPI003D0ED75E